MDTPNRTPDIKRKFVCNDIAHNNNKWWQIEYWELEQIWRVTFARVGQECSTPDIKDGKTIQNVNKKIEEKIKRNKGDSQYVEVELFKPSVSKVSFDGIDKPVADFVNDVFTAANENIYSYFDGKIDSLSPEQIKKGNDVLLSIKNGAKNKASLVETYFNIIPTKLDVNFVRRVGMAGVVDDFIENLGEHEERLQQLDAAVKGYVASQSGDDIFKQLGAKITVSNKEVKDNVSRLVSSTSRAKVLRVFDVYIETDRANYTLSEIENKRLLFHGTPFYNLRHILRAGLICPQQHSNGRAFGNGIYFADEAAKSINYMKKSRALLISEVKLGKMYNALKTLSVDSAPNGCDSVFAEKGKKISGVWNTELERSEYVVYNSKQQCIMHIAILDL